MCLGVLRCVCVPEMFNLSHTSMYAVRLLGFLIVLISTRNTFSIPGFFDEWFPIGLMSILAGLAIAIWFSKRKEYTLAEKWYYIGLLGLVIAKMHDIITIGHLFTHQRMIKSRVVIWLFVAIAVFLFSVVFTNYKFNFST